MADVDAELERARGDDAEHLARAQTLLDLAPAQRQVAAAVAADDAGVPRPVLDALLDGGQQDLRGQAALREDDGGVIIREAPVREGGRLAEMRGTNAELGIHDGRVVAHEELFARR